MKAGNLTAKVIDYGRKTGQNSGSPIHFVHLYISQEIYMFYA